MADSNNSLFTKVYQELLLHFGPRGWWPGESRLEVILGAILAQAVSWKNVEKAIANIKQAGLMDIMSLSEAEPDYLAELIRPALYHHQKAKKLKAMIAFINENYQGDLASMFAEETDTLRKKLLTIWGIGYETADSILLYAGDKLIFVVDAYTKRIFARLGMVDEKISYQEMQMILHKNVVPEVPVYNEYHALLVSLGNSYCNKRRPKCEECPIAIFCKYYSNLQEKK